jgi:hypothetical protein
MLACNHLPWRHRNVLVIAELYWIELRYQRFKLLWQTARLNKVNSRFFGRFVLIRIFRHASLLRRLVLESPSEARRAPSPQATGLHRKRNCAASMKAVAEALSASYATSGTERTRLCRRWPSTARSEARARANPPASSCRLSSCAMRFSQSAISRRRDRKHDGRRLTDSQNTVDGSCGSRAAHGWPFFRRAPF